MTLSSRHLSLLIRVAFPDVCGVFSVVSAHAAHGSARGLDPSFARDECSVDYMFEVVSVFYVYTYNILVWDGSTPAWHSLHLK
jgi:hypothetical protein